MAKTRKLITEVVERLKPIMKFDPIEEKTSYTIGQLSKRLGVSLRTLRFYEQAGLLVPGRDGLRRLYSREDLERLEMIVTLRELEVSLISIRALMAKIDAEEDLSEVDVVAETAAILVEIAKDNQARIDELADINVRIETARRNFIAE